MSQHFVVQLSIKKVERADATVGTSGRGVIKEGGERVIDEVINVTVRADRKDTALAKAMRVIMVEQQDGA